MRTVIRDRVPQNLHNTLTVIEIAEDLDRLPWIGRFADRDGEQTASLIILDL